MELMNTTSLTASYSSSVQTSFMDGPRGHKARKEEVVFRKLLKATHGRTERMKLIWADG